MKIVIVLIMFILFSREIFNLCVALHKEDNIQIIAEIIIFCGLVFLANFLGSVL